MSSHLELQVNKMCLRKYKMDELVDKLTTPLLLLTHAQHIPDLPSSVEDPMCPGQPDL